MTSPSSATGGFPDAWLAGTLRAAGMLSADQVSALQPGDEDPTVWGAVVRQGWISDLDVVLLLAREFKLKVADLSKIEQRASVLIPESLARKHRLVPISADERMIRVASADPRDHSAEQAVGFVTGRDVELLIASPAQILEKIDEVYRPERSIERLLQRLDPGKVEAFVEDSVIEMKDPGLEAPVADWSMRWYREAVREGASDIHAEPDETGTVVRYRVDGVLKEVMRLPQTAGAALVRRAKILSRLDVTDPLHPHDGRAAMRGRRQGDRSPGLHRADRTPRREGGDPDPRQVQPAGNRSADLGLPPTRSSICSTACWDTARGWCW